MVLGNEHADERLAHAAALARLDGGGVGAAHQVDLLLFAERVERVDRRVQGRWLGAGGDGLRGMLSGLGDRARRTGGVEQPRQLQAVGVGEAGLVADQVGIQASFVLGGILCILMAVTGLFIPAVMNMEKKDNSLPEAVGTSVRQAI